MDFRRQNPTAPVIVALTGTDLYRDIRINRAGQESLDVASRIVVLQSKAIEELRSVWRPKARVIYQSAEAVKVLKRATGRLAKTKGSKTDSTLRSNGRFNVCVIGHLRAVKDPFRTAMAARSLPDSSKIQVLQVGAAMTEDMAKRARREMSANKRYRWLGEQPRSGVRRILKKCCLSVISSRLEGGANVLSEAIVASVPILASRIDGNVGILGSNYPGYFDVGNTRQLARLLMRAETSPGYLAELRSWNKTLSPLVDPTREEQAWADLIGELHLPA